MSAHEGAPTAQHVTEAVRAFTAQVTRAYELVGTIKSSSERQTESVGRSGAPCRT